MRPANRRRGMSMKKTLFVGLALAAAQPACDEVIALKGARMIDGTGKPPLANAVLVVDGGGLAAVGAAGKVAIPKGARVVDLSGRTIMPGMINAHGHVGLVAGGQNRADAYTRENLLPQLALYEQYGVTAVLTLRLNRDLVYEIRHEQRHGALPSASIFTAGRGIGAPDGAPPLPVAPDQLYRPPAAGQAVAEVRQTAAHHPDYLQL